jgi:hypothetical protein
MLGRYTTGSTAAGCCCGAAAPPEEDDGCGGGFQADAEDRWLAVAGLGGGGLLEEGNMSKAEQATTRLGGRVNVRSFPDIPVFLADVVQEKEK